MRISGLIKRNYRFYVAWALWAVVLGCVPQIGFTMPVPSKYVKSEAEMIRSQQITKITSVLNEETVKARLEKLGLNPQEIKSRLVSLSDEDLSRLARQAEKIQAGGDALGLIVLVIVLVFLFWAIIFLTDHEVVVKHEYENEK